MSALLRLLDDALVLFGGLLYGALIGTFVALVILLAASR